MPEKKKTDLVDAVGEVAAEKTTHPRRMISFEFRGETYEFDYRVVLSPQFQRARVKDPTFMAPFEMLIGSAAMDRFMKSTARDDGFTDPEVWGEFITALDAALPKD